ALDEPRRRASLVRAFTHDPPVLAHMFGSVQAHANGNLLVGWGASPLFTEYSSDGRLVFDASLPNGGPGDPPLRFPWGGRPAETPALAARDGRLYASWNGTTETKTWRVLAGSSAGSLAATLTAPRRGFETAIAAPPRAKFAAVTALDAAGKPLAT